MTSREHRSPPTARVVQVLDYVAGHRDERLGLSDLSRRVGLKKATCLAVLNELVHAGYLVRDPHDKTYALGPALVPIGQAAAGGRALDLARPHMEALSADLGFEGTITAVAGDHIMVLAHTGPHEPPNPTVRVGQRYPFAPPWSFSHVVWSDDEGIEAWLDQPPLFPVEVDRERLRSVAAAARRTGHLVEVPTEIGARSNALLAQLAGERLPPEVIEAVGRVMASLGPRRFLTHDPGPAEVVEVSMLAAPVYDARGRLELLLALFGQRELGPGQLDRVTDRLRAATGEVTAAIGGHDPWAHDRKQATTT